MSEPETETLDPAIDAYIERWRPSAASERANYVSFLKELCDLLDLPQPDPAKAETELNAYVFERRVDFDNGDGTTSFGFIDLYKRDCFVLEAKQGSERDQESDPLLVKRRKARAKGTAIRGNKAWDDAMVRARGQAERYAKALPVDDGWPPFLIVVDVGHVFELYADFSRSGKSYTAFPDPRRHRIHLDDLSKEGTRDLLRGVWTEPMALDPTRRSAKVTREVATRLAALARSLESAGHAPRSVADFLMRCLFTMFAEDVGLIANKAFTGLLKRLEGRPEVFAPMAKSIWSTMNTGGFSPALEAELLQFDGGLFENADAPALDADQLALLIEAAEADWRDVEPAIFGTLLERALDPRERHKLGAHYTPRAYVERLVMPTVVEPLREEWQAVQAAAVTLATQGKMKAAAKEVSDFHRRLCELRVLDPACGSGNFLYVTLEHMKRLEGEVMNALEELDETQAHLEFEGHSVLPSQFLGLEINPRAAVIAEMVLWIGYLQWHFRTRSDRPGEPILRKAKNIECRDAVLAYDRKEIARDDHGKPITRWDGHTMKVHPVTGEDVPDETARQEAYTFVNPRPAEWPQADYVVGNPPFVGNKRMKAVLGDEYTDTLRDAYRTIGKTVDYVMIWWKKAASLLIIEKIKAFGFVTTNSIVQPFNRTSLAKYLDGNVGIKFAVTDHPWVDSTDGAAVRIAITTACPGSEVGILSTVFAEYSSGDGAIDVELETRQGVINSNLRIGVDFTQAIALQSNKNISRQGLIPLGHGFRLSPRDLMKFGYSENKYPSVIRRYRIGTDLTRKDVPKYVIDLFGYSEHSARIEHPMLYNHLHAYVKPKRDQNKRESRRKNWWIFGENAATLRPALTSINRYIATCRTARHRIFAFLDSDILPDAKIIAIGLSDVLFFGLLSSRIHIAWSMASGGWLGVGNDSNYNHSDCFAKFPFPDCSEPQKATIRALGEELDAHRKARQAAHPDLTMTAMYNVLEKLRAGAPLTGKDQTVHEAGLVSVLRQIHDDLDAAVFEAYGWPTELSDEAILERLVALNKERAAEEAKGLVRWLRPEFQCPEGTEAPTQVEIDMAAAPAAAAARKATWPKGLAEQARVVRGALVHRGAPVTVDQVARGFQRANRGRVEEILETLASLGQARAVGEDRYAP